MSGPRDITHTFAGAGQVQHQISGRFIRILDASDDVYVRLDGGSELLRKVGQSIDAAALFSRISIRSTVAQSVQLVVSDTPQEDNAQTLSATVSATVTPGNTLTTTTDVSVLATTTSQVLAGRADRLAVLVKNLNGNSSLIRVGESASVGAARGHELMPGESIMLAITATIFVYNADAAPQSVSLLEVREV